MNNTEKGSRKRAIRLKCLDCCCGNAAEVRLCTIQKCPLWRFRMGTESKGKKAASVQEVPENTAPQNQETQQREEAPAMTM